MSRYTKYKEVPTYRYPALVATDEEKINHLEREILSKEKILSYTLWITIIIILGLMGFGTIMYTSNKNSDCTSKVYSFALDDAIDELHRTQGEVDNLLSSYTYEDLVNEIENIKIRTDFEANTDICYLD